MDLDEIKRQRYELVGGPIRDAFDRLIAEVERLREQNEIHWRTRRALVKANQARQAEVDRLKAKVERLREEST